MELLAKVRKRRHKLTEHEISQIAWPAHWMHLCHFEGDYIKLDDVQISLINSLQPYIICSKARQLGFSTFCVAGRALVKAHLRPRFKSVISSYNLNEAKLKIRLAKELYEGIPERLKKKVISSHAFGMEFADGSSIISLFNPRGNQNCDVYFDEYAHVPDQNDLYAGGYPIINGCRKGDKQLIIGSTPLGKIGKFFEIFSQDGGLHTGYDRHIWFWWDSTFYCKDVRVARYGDLDKRLSPAYCYPTDERVHLFATDRFKTAYAENSGDIEIFQQEYESYFCDESQSFFPFDLIAQRMRFFDFDQQAQFPSSLEDIGKFAKGRLFAGYDVGVTMNTSEFFVFDYRDKDDGFPETKFVQVFHKSFKNISLTKQQRYLEKFLKMYPNQIHGMLIDKQGIGFQMSTYLEEEYPSICRGETLSGPRKAELAWIMKSFFKDGKIELWPDRETRTQIHSIKQIMSSTGNIPRYDTDKNDKNHHADRFWGIALACGAACELSGILPEIFICRLRREAYER